MVKSNLYLCLWCLRNISIAVSQLTGDCFYIFLLGGIEGIPALVSSLDPTKREQFLSRCSARPGDLILFAVGHHASVNKTLDRLRVFVAHELDLIDDVSVTIHIYDVNIVIVFLICWPLLFYFVADI